MSMEVVFLPMLFDVVALAFSLGDLGRRITVSEQAMVEAAAEDYGVDLDALKQRYDVKTASVKQTRGSAVVIHTDEGYDIGLRRNSKGAYDIVGHWPGETGKAQVEQIRKDIEERIRQKYAYEKVKRELARKGFLISNEEVQPDQTIRLVARKW